MFPWPNVQDNAPACSQKPDLIRATLSTMHVYLSWVPIGYIFSSNMVEQLLKLFPQAPYRNVALQCLTEVGENAILQLHAAKPVQGHFSVSLGASCAMFGSACSHASSQAAMSPCTL